MANQALTADMTDEQFDRHTMQILARELGLGGLARYIRLHRSGPGDYTRDRPRWLDGVTLEDIARDLGVEMNASTPVSSSTTPPR